MFREGFGAMDKLYLARVTIAAGTLVGNDNGSIASFFGVPYAEPPQAAARFAAPEHVKPWVGDRTAQEYGATAPQPRRDSFGSLDMKPYFGPGWVRGENYLNVNIWTPSAQLANTTSALLPVMVFVHGGGFVAGANSAALYDGTRFAQDEVVFVSVNYRLGVPGFLSVPGTPENRGLMDVIAALRWVQENVTSFGGDPANVTLMGQSAGATLISSLLTDPAAPGLVRRAIIQSGNGEGAFSPAQAHLVTERLAAALDIPATFEGFASVDDDAIIDALPNLAGLNLNVDGKLDPLAGLSAFSLVLEQQPVELIRSGLAGDVDLMIGTNSQEGNLYLVPTGSYYRTTRADVDALRTQTVPEEGGEPTTVATKRLGARRSELLGDRLFVSGTNALIGARLQAASAPTFTYKFAWPSPALNGDLGACHAIELPFVFDNTAMASLHGTSGLLGEEVAPAELASSMHAAWVKFAKQGNPGWNKATVNSLNTKTFGP